MVNITNAVFFYGFSVYNHCNRIHTFMIFFFCFTLPLFFYDDPGPVSCAIFLFCFFFFSFKRANQADES